MPRKIAPKIEVNDWIVKSTKEEAIEMYAPECVPVVNVVNGKISETAPEYHAFWVETRELQGAIEQGYEVIKKDNGDNVTDRRMTACKIPFSTYQKRMDATAKRARNAVAQNKKMMLDLPNELKGDKEE